MKVYVKIVIAWKPLTIFAKCSAYVWQGSEQAFGEIRQINFFTKHLRVTDSVANKDLIDLKLSSEIL